MFNLDTETLTEIINRFGLENEIVRITNVFEVYNHFWFMIRAGIFASLLVSLMSLLLAVITVFQIVNLEYTVNAIELCVKKIHGYGVLKKTMDIIGSLLICNLISIVITVIIMVIILDMSALAVAISVSIIIIIDFIALLLSTHRIEKVRITKILKGGAL
ncbi:MAG: hypothetical protein FWC09_01850 [Lachnospiraceae bacterium]|nr:hypothetical protein [Lachnospiraceae bacterium]